MGQRLLSAPADPALGERENASCVCRRLMAVGEYKTTGRRPELKALLTNWRPAPKKSRPRPSRDNHWLCSSAGAASCTNTAGQAGNAERGPGLEGSAAARGRGAPCAARGQPPAAAPAKALPVRRTETRPDLAQMGHMALVCPCGSSHRAGRPGLVHFGPHGAAPALRVPHLRAPLTRSTTVPGSWPFGTTREPRGSALAAALTALLRQEMWGPGGDPSPAGTGELWEETVPSKQQDKEHCHCSATAPEMLHDCCWCPSREQGAGEQRAVVGQLPWFLAQGLHPVGTPQRKAWKISLAASSKAASGSCSPGCVLVPHPLPAHHV